MNPASKDVKDMLVADTTLGLVFATNLFIGKEPSAPDNCVTLFDSMGWPPGLTLDQQKYYYPSIRIQLRNKSYEAGMELAIKIMDSLHGRAQETWNDTLYSVIMCVNDPGLMDWDTNSRALFSLNFNIQRR